MICSREIKLFHAKMSLLLKIVEGSNTAVYLPAEGAMRFLLPQLPGSEYNNHTGSAGEGQQQQEVRFLEVDIPMPPERMTSEEFAFTDKIWDDLEAAQGVIDDSLYPHLPPPLVVVVDGAGDGDGEEDAVYTPVTAEGCPSSAAHQKRVGETFFDSEDRVNYKVVAVCTSTTYGPEKLFFKYFNVDQFPSGPPPEAEGGEGRENTELHEYTPCDELVSASWATWRGDEEQWIQCGACDKWRKVPPPPCSSTTTSSSGDAVQLSDFPDEWTCSMATWLQKGEAGEGAGGRGACEVPEEEYEHTVSLTEAVNGVLVPATAATSTGTDTATLLSTETAAAAATTTTATTANILHVNANATDNTATATTATATVTTGNGTDIVYTVDLQTAVRHIVSALKSNVGNKLLTRLSPETTHGVLQMALQQN